MHRRGGGDFLCNRILRGGGCWSYVAGALLSFFISGLFDEMDGMLARIESFPTPPFGTYLEGHADSLSYLLLFGGMTMGLYREHGDRELWIGAALLIGAVPALVITTLQRKRRAAGDRPSQRVSRERLLSQA